MPERSTRFLIDTNVFIASIKRGKTKSTELFLRLLDGPFDLIADDILVTEYERYAGKFGADEFLRIVLRKIVIIEQSEEDILACKPFFPPGEGADVIHAAACMHAKATIRIPALSGKSREVQARIGRRSTLLSCRSFASS